MPEDPLYATAVPSTEAGGVASVELDRLTEPPAPIPVLIANPPKPADDDVSDSFQTDQVLVDGTAAGMAHNSPRRIAERQADRISVTVVNTDAADTVFVMTREGNRATGFPLVAGASLTLKTRAPVYAMIAADAQALVAVVAEFRAAKATD